MTESMEVKVAKLETKVDTILEKMSIIEMKIDKANRDYVSRDEFNALKIEIRQRSFKAQLLTSVITFIVTMLVTYFAVDILGR